MIASGLPDTKRERKIVFVRGASLLTKAILRKRCVVAADDYGSINAWVDDHGKYRGEAMRHMHTIELKTFPNLKAIRQWYKEWLMKIANRPPSQKEKP